MIKKHYSGNARRARNIIWNAAGRYDFDPPFMAFYANGVPDHYFNMVAGLAHKWLDIDRIWNFFEGYTYARRADEFDDLLWMGLENCMYEKEVKERPIMEQLRSQRAERFFKEQQQLSVQQMEYQSMLVYNQQEYRWAGIAGRRSPLLSPKEKAMAEALKFSGDLDTDGVIAAMENFLQSFFKFDPDEMREKRRKSNFITRHILRKEHRKMDQLLVRAGTGEGDHEKARQQRHEGFSRKLASAAENETYIKEVFGSLMISETEMRILENDLCTDADEDCRLWLTKGDTLPTDNKEVLEIRESSERQKIKNEKYRAEHQAAVESSIRALSARLDTVFSSYFKHMPEKSRAGRIKPELAYRLPVLEDSHVFLKDGEETEPEICIDLLLDASQSRMNTQEVLATEAEIIARSMERVGVPVRVHTFRSIRGYTVLELLKGFNDKDCKGLMKYFAGGWNRDGLAIKTLAHLDDDATLAARKRIILVMTDGAPNDTTPLVTQKETIRGSREYEGLAAVQATKDAVRKVRADGAIVGAVFHGNAHNVENVGQIFGNAYVRIYKASQLAEGVSNLLLLLMRENELQG